MKNWREILNQQGYVYLPQKGEKFLKKVLDEIGEVIMITDVKINPKSRSLVTSTRALDFHTDHHLANYIVWYCIEQTSSGGESIILNAENIYKKLEETEQQELKQIKLYEHKVFPTDREHYPLVYEKDGITHFYYSFWLVNENDKKNKALQKFKELIQNSKHTKILLKPNDILIINNHKVFHGRTAITGSKNRFLKRFWIKSNV